MQLILICITVVFEVLVLTNDFAILLPFGDSQQVMWSLGYPNEKEKKNEV